MQPGELAIDEALGAIGNRGKGFERRFFLFNYNGLFGFHEKLDPIVRRFSPGAPLARGRANNMSGG
jgi:hypothetical protein